MKITQHLLYGATLITARNDDGNFDGHKGKLRETLSHSRESGNDVLRGIDGAYLATTITWCARSLPMRSSTTYEPLGRGLADTGTL